MLLYADAGAVAHLGERRVRNAEVEGSTPFGSTHRPAGKFQAACFFAARARYRAADDSLFGRPIGISVPSRLVSDKRIAAVEWA